MGKNKKEGPSFFEAFGFGVVYGLVGVVFGFVLKFVLSGLMLFGNPDLFILELVSDLPMFVGIIGVAVGYLYTRSQTYQ